ncbi:endonuclease/Exonuclease/phosphatase [Colletotrichum karsti]|uniref:DNA-(apurinic or apyrimidinic site) endonuclease 2 n=1 Tax=Colletotrichum karsti TaxID=1095194 RepID=A0A9P6LH25_9PEZI|nr:endonuclease/Exonuclease/phosphatase [Colletotrichum karsti]KAF9872190.1 endonuclease/Exonuclease/phosphatase [Colletotrichum karsti]
MGLRIVTWNGHQWHQVGFQSNNFLGEKSNVSGIHSDISHGERSAMFEILEADIVIMQETKIQRKDLQDDMVLVPGWDVHFSLPKHKKGYSGVAIYTRTATCCPIRAEEGITGILTPPNSSTSFRDLPPDQRIGGYPRANQLPGEVDEATLDSEGRCMVLEFPAFVLIGTYSPATRDSSRDDFRLGYLNALDARVRNLVAEGKEVILTGDLNVIREEQDTCNLREVLRKEGMSVEDWMEMPSRRLFNHLVFDGDITGERDEGREKPVLHDLTRIFHPKRQGMFTCWDTKRNTRPANNGSRIDYILCSTGIKDWFTGSNIQEGLMGSDHCPVYATIGDTVSAEGKETPVLDLMNPSDMFREGKRLREWSPKDLLPLSAKLIPEFDRRRNIRDMFMKKPAPKPTPADPPSSAAAEDAPTQESEQLVSTPSQASDVPSSQSQSLPSPSATKIAASRPSNTLPPQTNLSTKRQAEARGPVTKRSTKRTKTNDTDSSGTKTNNKQSTLTGFFKPKQPVTEPAGAAGIDGDEGNKNNGPGDRSPEAQMTTGLDRSLPVASQDRAAVGVSTEIGSMSPASPSSQTKKLPALPLKTSAIETAERVFDPIETKEAWSKFSLGKRVVPKCEHGEPCISFQTKKPGINCGRSFYICARPLGQSGVKESGTEWRCGTFIWSSDWKKDQAQM